jgi:hypothetical protein
MGETLLQTQNRRFREQIAEILRGESLKVKVDFDDKIILKSAKINYSEAINKRQFNALFYLSENWDSDFDIKRSGAGLVINFKAKKS